jgi:hypothetical protein
MGEAQQLERIEDTLTKIGVDISDIKANQASDFQRFKQVDDKFVALVAARAAAMELHAATCEVKGKVTNLEKRFDAADNTARGAWWAGGRIWAAMVAVLVLVDLACQLYQAAK